MRIPGIGVVVALDAKVVMPHEAVIKAGPSNVRCMEGGMGSLRTLKVLAEAGFGSMKQGQVHTSAIHLKLLQKISGLGRLEMGNSPDGETVVHDFGLEIARRKDPNIGAPICGSIDAGECQPIVISGCHQHRGWMEVGEGLPDQAGCVGRVELLLVQISRAKQCVDLLFPGQVGDVGQGIPQAVTELAGGLRLLSQPGKSPVQVQIGKEEESRC